MNITKFLGFDTLAASAKKQTKTHTFFLRGGGGVELNHTVNATAYD